MNSWHWHFLDNAANVGLYCHHKKEETLALFVVVWNGKYLRLPRMHQKHFSCCVMYEAVVERTANQSGSIR
jgi:hypothetical protein